MNSRSASIPTSFGKVAALIDHPGDSPVAPVVVLLHGFTGWKEEAHLASLAAALCEVGIVAVRFDAPGSGGSDGTFLNDYRLSSSIAAVGDILKWVASDPAFDANRTAIWGHSMGGFAAIASGVRYGDRLRAVCGSQPSWGKSSVSEEVRNEWERTDVASFPNLHFRTLDLPYAFYLDRQQFDVFEELPSLHIPLLAIAGTRDPVVPASSVRKIFEAANEPKTYREFNVDHFYKKSVINTAEINAATVDFFTQWVGE